MTYITGGGAAGTWSVLEATMAGDWAINPGGMVFTAIPGLPLDVDVAGASEVVYLVFHSYFSAAGAGTAKVELYDAGVAIDRAIVEVSPGAAGWAMNYSFALPHELVGAGVHTVLAKAARDTGATIVAASTKLQILRML